MGHHSENNSHLSSSPPPPTSHPTVSSRTADIMEQIPSIDSQSEQEQQQNEDEPGSNGKRDLYVGNL